MPNRKRRISRISLARDARRLPLNNAPTLWVLWGKYIQRFKARTQEHQKNQIKNQFKCSESQDQPLKKFLAFFNIPKISKISSLKELPSSSSQKAQRSQKSQKCAVRVCTGICKWMCRLSGMYKNPYALSGP